LRKSGNIQSTGFEKVIGEKSMLEKTADAGKDLGKRFRDSAAGLVQITFEGCHEDGNSQYGVLYAKPSQRLAGTLCVDRELLVLTSPFREQQVRTINAALKLIDGSAGRLEPHVAIIVHADQRGNHKLKNWGRERGLSVLPIFAGNEQLPIGERFESLLAAELFSHDPFDVTGPVADEYNFFGRRTEAQDLSRKLQNGQIRACFGIRKIGKTSILNRVIRECDESYDCLCIVMDCSRDEIWSLSASEILDSLTTSIEEACKFNIGYKSVVPLRSNKDLKDVSVRLTDAIQRSEKPVIVFLDEVDYISPGSPTANHWKAEFNAFWRTVRALYQENTRKNHNLSLFISGVSSKWFSEESIDGIENAALSLVPEEYLLPLGRGASVAMIKTMSRRAGLVVAEDVADAIADTCSDIPFWIRKAGSYIHRQIAVDGRPTPLQFKRTNELLDEFVESDGAPLAGVALRHLFRVYPELLSACEACGAADLSNIPSHLSNTLEKYGIFKLQGKQTVFSGPMVRAGWTWYRENQKSGSNDEPNEPTVRDPQETLNENLYGNWADELAMIGKRRNVLERVLRETVLNFLKLDSLKNKQKGTTQQRVLSSLAKERRDKLSTTSAHEIMSKLFWLELCQIIKREWDLFGPLFNDKNAFELNTMIVNERPDTHAKELDQADIALHKRALAWLEERALSS
jgi:hypothetical protein